MAKFSLAWYNSGMWWNYNKRIIIYKNLYGNSPLWIFYS